MSVFWGARDIFVAGAVVFGALGLLSRAERARAVVCWLVAALGTLAGLASDEFGKGLLGLTDDIALLGVILSASLILLSFRFNLRSGIRGRAAGRDFGDHTAVYPYRVRDQFLSPAERSFFGVLRAAVDDRAIIFSKVRLWDIFYVPNPRESRGAQNRIDRKHVDFLLCNPQTLQPIAGIELDDSSHKREDRQARDELVEGTFEAAGLPLIRVAVKSGYSVNELRSLLSSYLGAERAAAAAETPAAPTASVVAGTSGAMSCPKCGAEMVIRVAKRGQYQGQKFYACTNYPNCKTTLPVK